MKADLISKIENREVIVGIIGLGYVGVPILCNFAENYIRCIGFDIDESKVETIRRGESYISYIPSEQIKRGVESSMLRVTNDFSAIKDCDAIIITVPTPLNVNREPDISFISSTCETISQHMRKKQIIILGSTTYPGTTEEVVVPILEKSGLKVERDFFVAYSPEREDPNNKNYSTANIPKVIGATSPEGLAVADKLFQQIVDKTVPVSSTRTAEASKLLENIFRAINIALVNELKIAFTKMGIDIWEVIEAASSKPFGFMPFYPGPGLGGHCIPIDPFYLTWKAREYGVYTRFIELAGEINTSMPDFVVTKVIDVLNEHGKPLKGSKILILGLAYKPDVDDDRESPSFYLMDKLEEKGALVSYNDPHIPLIRPSRLFAKYAGRKSKPVSGDYDLILICTAHDVYKTIDFHKYNIPTVDTRNILHYDAPWLYKA